MFFTKVLCHFPKIKKTWSSSLEESDFSTFPFIFPINQIAKPRSYTNDLQILKYQPSCFIY